MNAASNAQPTSRSTATTSIGTLCSSARREPRRRRRTGNSAGRGGESRALLRPLFAADLAHRHPQAQDHRRIPQTGARTDGRYPGGSESDEEFADLHFNKQDTDHWHSFPTSWGNPERSLEDKRFWEAFDQCSQQMPGQVARVFYMRELMGLETEQICQELSITPTNCWVMLYRARMNLRQCWRSAGSPARVELYARDSLC
jgi:DNA-directed RNA polymerase specialized sigma24 family protein